MLRTPLFTINMTNTITSCAKPFDSILPVASAACTAYILFAASARIHNFFRDAVGVHGC